MSTTPYWLIALLSQAAAGTPPPGAPAGEAARLRDAGQTAVRQWIGCVVDGGRARASTGVAVEAAVAEARAGCAAQREAAGRGIEAAEHAAGNPVTAAHVAELVGQIEQMIGATAPSIVGSHLTRESGKKRRR